MINLVISGCNGRMGRAVTERCESDGDIRVVAGFDLSASSVSGFPVFASPSEYKSECDCVIDFSNPAALLPLLDYCLGNKVPLVICTTGHNEEQMEAIRRAAEAIPVFKSGNMSLGINLLLALVKQAARVLGGAYDIEILEKHHNQKVDAPSGTALMIADAAASALDFESEYVYGRHDVRKPRAANEIGISSVRGGTVVGEHEVMFLGRDEIIEIRHSASSREIFATGAVKAVKFLSSVDRPGLYDMSNVIG